jgi:FecR-like protein
MFFSWARPRDAGSGARGTRCSSALVLLIGLVLEIFSPATPAMAYAVDDAIEDAMTSPAARIIAAPMRLAQTQPQPSPASPAPATNPASSSASPAADPIGNVATLTGSATVTRNSQSAVPLQLKDDIYLNDVLQTAAGSTLGVTFNDETTFNLTANAAITVDNFVYEDGGKQNSALFNITQGTVAFVAASLARTGDMKIATPTATLGIRGTTGLVEVNGAAGGGHNIKLYPDPDGHVGTIDISDRRGARLGSLTQGASGFSLRAGPGGRITAAPLVISPREAARDQGIVRQVHAAQAVGRRVVNEQRALRRANPNRANPNRTNPRNAPGQPGERRQNNLQQRPGELQRPPNAPALRQGGLPNRIGAPPKKPPPPKKPKEKR